MIGWALGAAGWLGERLGKSLRFYEQTYLLRPRMGETGGKWYKYGNVSVYM